MTKPRAKKLSPTQIKNVQESTETAATLAVKYGVCKATIYNYKNKNKNKKQKPLNSLGETIEEARLHSLLTPDAVDMIITLDNGKGDAVTALATVINWAAAASKAGAVINVKSPKKEKLSFAQKMKKALHI